MSGNIRQAMKIVFGALALFAAYLVWKGGETEQVVYVSLPVINVPIVPPNTLLTEDMIGTISVPKDAAESMLAAAQQGGDMLLTMNNISSLYGKVKTASVLAGNTPLYRSQFVNKDATMVPSLQGKYYYTVALGDLGVEVPANTNMSEDTFSLCFYIANPDSLNRLTYVPPDILDKYRNGIMECPLENVRMTFLKDGQLVSGALYMNSRGQIKMPTSPNEVAIILGDMSEISQDEAAKRLSLLQTWLSHLGGDSPLLVSAVLYKGDPGKEPVFYTNAAQTPVYFPDGMATLEETFPEATSFMPVPQGYYYDPYTGQFYYAGEPLPTPTEPPEGYATPTPTLTPTPTPTPEG